MVSATGSGGVNLAEYITKMDYLKISAGWPLASFKIPKINFTILKTALDNTGVDISLFYAIVTKSKLIVRLVCTANLEDKNSDFYRVEATYKHSLTGKYRRDHPDYDSGNAAPLISNAADLGGEYVNFKLSTIYDAVGATYPNDPTRNYYYRILYVSTIVLDVDEDLIRDILQLSRWCSFYSPGLVTLLGSTIIPLTFIKLNDPVLFYNLTLNPPISLDISKITKWSRVDYRPGFEVNSEEENYRVGKIGKGPTHSINLDSHFDSLVDENKDELDISDVMVDIKANINNLFSYVGKTLTTIETLQNIALPPYYRVEIDGEKFYVLEIQIPIKSYEPYKYKLIERL